MIQWWMTMIQSTNSNAMNNIKLQWALNDLRRSVTNCSPTVFKIKPSCILLFPSISHCLIGRVIPIPYPQKQLLIAHRHDTSLTSNDDNFNVIIGIPHTVYSWCGVPLNNRIDVSVLFTSLSQDSTKRLTEVQICCASPDGSVNIVYVHAKTTRWPNFTFSTTPAKVGYSNVVLNAHRHTHYTHYNPLTDAYISRQHT